MLEDARQRSGTREFTEHRVEKYSVQNSVLEDLGSIPERDGSAKTMSIFFVNVSMLAEEAHRSVYLPFSSINFL